MARQSTTCGNQTEMSNRQSGPRTVVEPSRYLVLRTVRTVSEPPSNRVEPSPRYNVRTVRTGVYKHRSQFDSSERCGKWPVQGSHNTVAAVRRDMEEAGTVVKLP